MATSGQSQRSVKVAEPDEAAHSLDHPSTINKSTSTGPYQDATTSPQNRDSQAAANLAAAKPIVLFAAVFLSTFLMALNGSIISTYTYITFASIFSVGALVCATAPSSTALIVGRAIQGIGGAGVINGAFAVIGAAASPQNRPRECSLGSQSAFHRFYINLPPGGLVVCTLLSLTIPEQIKKQPVRGNLTNLVTKELDLVGFTLFAPACIMFLLAMIWGGEDYRWDSSVIIGLFCGAFVTFITFATWEYFRGDKAMIPPSIARKPLVMFGGFTSFLQVGALLLLSYYLPLWFQVVKDDSPLMSGVMVLPTAISQAIAGITAGKLVQVIGYYTPWALLGCIWTSVGSGLMTTFTGSSGAGAWIGYQILAGAGRGTVVQMPITAIQNLLPPKEVSIASSQIFFWQYLGGATFLAIGETIFTNTLRSSLKTYAPGVNPQDVIDVGALAVRSSAPKADLENVLRAYNHAIVTTFYLAVGASSAAFLTSFGMGFQKLPKRQAPKKSKGSEA
ncbi:MFS multidrug transporter [Cladophialophora carrionii]|uniref:MFS multidrug transporter n=1 Tax=Cladophialophora carrionii TaxID=86049 RepID=A0A1C1CN50_9EURO|nr:MFS multidrug transporter [Cladophialophora carrionii]